MRDQVLHLFHKLVRSLLLALELDPALLNGVQGIVVHPLDGTHGLLAI